MHCSINALLTRNVTFNPNRHSERREESSSLDTVTNWILRFTQNDGIERFLDCYGFWRRRKRKRIAKKFFCI